jgi:hypothetical protein
MKMFASIVVLMSAMQAFAQQERALTASSPSLNGVPTWNLDPAYWETLITADRDSPIRLGRSDVTVSGPLVFGLRSSRTPADASAARRFVDLPVIRLFVPQPMPTPPETSGRYFAWRGSSPRPWANVSTRGGAAAGAYDPTRRDAGALISLSR